MFAMLVYIVMISSVCIWVIGSSVSQSCKCIYVSILGMGNQKNYASFEPKNKGIKKTAPSGAIGCVNTNLGCTSDR